MHAHTYSIHIQYSMNAHHTEETSHKNTSPDEPEVFITSGSRLHTPARAHYKTHGQPRTVPVCKYSLKMSACGSKTCNFHAASILTGWVFALVAKETGVQVSVSWCGSV